MVRDPLLVGLFHASRGLFDSPGFHLLLLTIFAATVIGIVRTAPGNICLGVNIPPDKYDEPACRRLRRRFELGVVILAVLAAIAIWRSATQMSKANMDAVVFSCIQVLFFVGILVWFYYVIRRAMFKLVEREGWFAEREPGKVVIDTSFHQRKKSLSPFWLLSFPLIIFMTLSAYQYWRPELYSGMLQPMFDELGFRNVKPSVFGDLSAGDVIAVFKNLAFYMQIMFTVFTVLVFIIIAKARQSLDPNDPSGSLEEELRRRKKSQAMLLVAYAMCMMIIAVLPFVICRNAIVPLFAYGVFPIYAATTFFLIYLNSRMGKTPTAKSGGNKRENRLFYHNADDPALFLWSRTGVGFVMNIARPTVKIICAGFCLLAVGLLWYVVCNAPMTSPGGFFARVDMATKSRDTHGANLFFNAALHNGTIKTSETAAANISPLSVKGTIELIEITANFPAECDIWECSNDFKNKLQDYLDDKITLDQFGEHYKVETICEEKVVFGQIERFDVSEELQKLRDKGQFDHEKHPAISIDGDYIDGIGPECYRHGVYDTFKFETMGQLEGRAVDSLVAMMADRYNKRDLLGMDVFHHFRETFLRDTAIVDYYHGKTLFEVVDTETYDGDNQAQVLEGRTYTFDRSGWSTNFRVLIDPSRGYASPYGWFSYPWKREGWRASGYFKFNTNRWLPRNYKTYRFSWGQDFVSKEAKIVRVTLDPDTVKENRKYQETWDEQTQTRAYVEVNESQEIGR